MTDARVGAAADISPFEMSSISETKIVKPSPAAMIEHNNLLISRIYPDAKRQDSSNADVCGPWSLGCQMVGLNIQTWDLQQRLNFAKFQLNGAARATQPSSNAASPHATPALHGRLWVLGYK